MHGSRLAQQSCIFFRQGSQEIKNYYRPHELVFTVDDVISRGIKETIQIYEETVSPIKLIYNVDGIRLIKFNSASWLHISI